MINAQRNDAYFRRIIDFIEENKIPPEANEARQIIIESENYFLQDRILYHWKQRRIRKPATPESKLVKQLCIPANQTEALIKTTHEGGYHFSSEYIYSKLNSWAFWPKMYTEIQQFCANCVQCQLGKSGYPPPQPPLQNIEFYDELFSAWTIDFLKLSLTSDGYQYILLCVENTSHLTVLIPTKDQSASTVADCLYNNIICQFGVMRYFKHDRGASFLAKPIQILCERYGVKQICSTPNHPKTQTICERQNRTVLNILRCEPDAKEKWPFMLSAISLALKSTPSKALNGYSPWEIITGRKCRTVEQQNIFPAHNTTAQAPDKQIIQIQENLSLIQKLVKEGRERYLTSIKNTFDRNHKAKLQHFEIDDLVLKLRDRYELRSPIKMFTTYMGPYRICDKNDTFNTYRLVDMEGKINPNFIHVCKLKRFTQNDLNEPEVPTENPTRTPPATTKKNTPINSHEAPPIDEHSTITRATHSDTDSFSTPPSDASGEKTNYSEVDDSRVNLPQLKPDANIRRSIRIQEKSTALGNNTLPDGRRFYGSRNITTETSPTINSTEIPTPDTTPNPRSTNTTRKSILKKTADSVTMPRSAIFRVRGRPINGNVRTVKIRIARVIYSKKVHNNREFYVELEEKFNHTKFHWVSEFCLEPKLEGVREKRFPFVHRPYN